MIKFSDVVMRLRTECPIFQNRVGSSVAFEAAIRGSGDLPTPHCFVMPVDFRDFSLIEYDEKYPDALKIKVIQERFATIVCIDNRDNRGHRDGGTNSNIPLDLLTDIQNALEDAFQAWKPTGMTEFSGDINLSGGEYVDSDNSLLWYSFEWSILYRRGNSGLSDEQQAEIDLLTADLSEEDHNMIMGLDTMNINNPMSDPDLQPVASLEDSYGVFPEGPVDPIRKEYFDNHLDVGGDDQPGDGFNNPDDDVRLLNYIAQWSRFYQPGINQLVGGQPNCLDYVPTFPLQVHDMIAFYADERMQVFRLKHESEIEESSVGPDAGVVFPLDFDADNNNKVWSSVL